MIKKLFILVLLISLNAFSHTVKDGDMDGAWRAIEVFINGEKQENIDTVMVASDGYSSINWTGPDGNKYFNYASYEVKNGLVPVSYTHLTLPTNVQV